MGWRDLERYIALERKTIDMSASDDLPASI